MLPVISSDIGGQDGLYKRGNVLLDSGAQISLIHLDTAEALGLEGKNVSITITKIGGEEEEMKTKEFKVRVTSLENKQSFVIKAVGILQISNNIVRITKEDVAEITGTGAVDLLIGTEHARMQTGETKQSGHLVARNSPLGCVIFGATPGKSQEVNRVLLSVTPLLLTYLIFGLRKLWE